MKKLSKVFALIFAVLCIGVGLAACGAKAGTFSYANCRSKYIDAGYKITNLSVAINYTNRYLELLEKETLTASQEAEKTELANKGILNIKGKGGGVLLVSKLDDKNAALELYTERDQYSYRTSGFIAIKDDATPVVIIQYKSTSEQITDYKEKLDGYYYSNITAATMNSVYDWGQK